MFGLVKTGRVPRRDFVCQGCGATFAVERWPLRLLAGLVLAPEAILLGLIVGLGGVASLLDSPIQGIGLGTLGFFLLAAGLLFGGWAATPAWIAWTRPVAPDAAAPEVRYRLIEPVRRCSCGAAVACHGVTAHTTNGIPTGTEYAYACRSCGREFVVESPWGQFFGAFASSAIALLGLLLLSTSPGKSFGQWALSGGVLLLGVGGGMLTLYRFAARFRFPVVSQAKLAQPG